MMNKVIQSVVLATGSIAVGSSYSSTVTQGYVDAAAIGMPTIEVDGYSFNVTDYTGTTSEISTGQWVQLKSSNGGREYFKANNNPSFNGKHGLASGGRVLSKTSNAMDDWTKFMLIVTDPAKKEFFLLDKDGYCYKRMNTGNQYWYSPGLDFGCDSFSTMTVKDVAKGGFTIEQSGYKVQNILNGIYYLGMTQQATNSFQIFNFLVTDSPSSGTNNMVNSNTLTNIVYDMANGKAVLKPESVGEVTCKTGDIDATIILKQTVSASITSTFQSSATLKVGVTVGFSAQIPLVATVTGSVTTEFSATITKTNAETLTEIQEQSVQIHCPANSKSKVHMLWQKGEYNIPYVADLERVVYINGAPIRYIFKGIKGIYNGISGTEIEICDEHNEDKANACDFSQQAIPLN